VIGAADANVGEAEPGQAAGQPVADRVTAKGGQDDAEHRQYR
jgi:hypothetical protein